jgi:hypothetical protein
MARATASGEIAILSIPATIWAFIRICCGVREIGFNEARRNDCDAQFITGLLAQTLGDGAHGELSTGVDRHGRLGDKSSCRSYVNEMPETLLSEDRQRCPNTVQNLCAEAGIKKWLPSSFNLE